MVVPPQFTGGTDFWGTVAWVFQGKRKGEVRKDGTIRWYHE